MVPEVLVMSAYRWHQLSQEDQSLVRQVAEESVTVERELWDARVSAAHQEMIEAGVTIAENIDKGPFVEAVASLYDQYLQEPSLRELVEKISAVY